MRSQAECRVISLNVPEASVTTNTSKPSSIAESAGKATQTSVTTPAMMSCFLPVAFTALTKSVVVPGIDVAGPGDVRRLRELLLQLRHQRAVGAVSKLVVRMVGSLKYLARSPSASTLFLNLSGIEIAHQRQQAGLMVDQQHGGVVLVETDVGFAHGTLLR